MLEVANDYRGITVIYFENTSGEQIGVFDGLLFKHLVEIHDKQYGRCYGFTGYAESKEEYTTFLTPEATKALDKCLDSR